MTIKLADYRTGTFLKSEDVPEPMLATIEKISVEEVGENKDKRLVAHFTGMDQAMVLNRTNLEFLEQSFGPNAEDAHGGQGVIFTDPNVRFGGKRVGGLRLRRPKAGAKKPAKTVAEELDDDIPF